MQLADSQSVREAIATEDMVAVAAVVSVALVALVLRNRDLTSE